MPRQFTKKIIRYVPARFYRAFKRLVLRSTDIRAVSKIEPEKAVAYDKSCIRALYEKYQLKISAPIHYENWCGRKEHLGGQDVVVAEKA